MLVSRLPPKDFFDLDTFKFRKIFNSVYNVWEAVEKISKVTKRKLIKGENCAIADSALIREGVILADNVVVGHCVELKNCILLNNAHIAHFNYIGDSIIGSNVNIGAGAILANFRLDQKPVTLNLGKKKINTGLVKFGSIVGDNCQIGGNAVLNPGTILGKNCKVYPLSSVFGFHKSHSVIK